MNKENPEQKSKKKVKKRSNLTTITILVVIFGGIVAYLFYNEGYHNGVINGLVSSCIIEDVKIVDGKILAERIWVNEKGHNVGYVVLSNPLTERTLIWVSPYDKITVEFINGKMLTEVVPCVGEYEIGSILCSAYNKEICNYVFSEVKSR